VVYGFANNVSSTPSDQPSALPSLTPSNIPSVLPSDQPSATPSALPSSLPSNLPSLRPSSYPSNQPSATPSDQPSVSWSLLGSDIDGEAAIDWSGFSVSLSSDGKTVAIGAPLNDGNGSNRGHTRVLQWNAITLDWVKMGNVIYGEAAGDTSGYSVSLSSDGKTIAIGSRTNQGKGWYSGHTRVFGLNTSTQAWIQIGDDIDGEAPGDTSGTAVSLSSDGKTVAIGARGNDGVNGSDSGHVRVFQLNAGGAWVQMGVDIDGEAANDRSGESVSLSSDGKIVAIAAKLNYGNGYISGQTRVFQWNAITLDWVQMGIDIDGEAAGDQSGSSVSLSSDGKIVAIGAYTNDGNGSNSGHTRVFQWNAGDASTPGAWVKMGVDIDGEAAGDESGFSVSLSSDGKTVAIGARGNDGNGVDSGHVRVYSTNTIS